MKQTILAVLGKRKAGKTTAAGYLHQFYPQADRLTAIGIGIEQFVKLHNITKLEFWDKQLHPHYRFLYGIFSETKRQRNPQIFLKPLLNYIKEVPFVIIEDIFYFNELEALIKLGAKLILIEADDTIREARNGGRLPVNDPLDMEVATISSHMMKNWKNTYVIKNNRDENSLKADLRMLYFQGE